MNEAFNDGIVYAQFKCPYCSKWWPEECKCDLADAILASELSKANAELADLRNELTGMMQQYNFQAEQDAQAVDERDREIAALRKLVREMGMVVEYVTRQASNEWVPSPWIQVSQEILNRPEVRAILEDKS